mgnify:CR=1 FL=1
MKYLRADKALIHVDVAVNHRVRREARQGTLPDPHAIEHIDIGAPAIHGAHQRDLPTVGRVSARLVDVAVRYLLDAARVLALSRPRRYGSANTKTLPTPPALTSGVRRLVEFDTSELPVVTATYCLPSTA